MTEILGDIIDILVGGISRVASGIGGGLQDLATAIFLETGEGNVTTLSVFGGLVVVFAGISLAVGLSRWAVSWLTSLGAFN